MHTHLLFNSLYNVFIMPIIISYGRKSYGIELPMVYGMVLLYTITIYNGYRLIQITFDNGYDIDLFGYGTINVTYMTYIIYLYFS